MGTGIAAAIPIEFEPYRDRDLDESYFPKRFLDNFNVKKSKGEKTYSIKTDLLINNYKVSGCRCQSYWMFYMGSYKAILEEYATLLHFEKILAKAMNNPLARAVKFGIFG